MHTFWLVLMIYLRPDWRIDDDSARFKFDSCVILWTNQNSLLSIETNQFASFCIKNRLRQSAIFVSVKVAKFEIKRLFSIYVNSFLYKKHSILLNTSLFPFPTTMQLQSFDKQRSHFAYLQVQYNMEIIDGGSFFLSYF